jgi:hypothetical protein
VTAQRQSIGIVGTELDGSYEEFQSLFMLFLWIIPAKAAEQKTSIVQPAIISNEANTHNDFILPIEPQQKQKIKLTGIIYT